MKNETHNSHDNDFILFRYLFIYLVVLHVVTTLPMVIPTGINTLAIIKVVCAALVFKFRFSTSKIKINIALILINKQDVTNALCLDK